HDDCTDARPRRRRGPSRPSGARARLGAGGYRRQSARHPDTLFMLASISKTVTAVALMQLYEQGRFGLDDPIDTNLGRLVRNPNFPSVPITYRMLLSHTSSIEDGLHYADYYVYDMDSPIALDAFVTGY